jgi:hypothetical protein
MRENLDHRPITEYFIGKQLGYAAKAYNEYQRKLMKAKRAEGKAKRAKPV